MRGSFAVSTVPKNEPKLSPGDADALGVDLRSRRQPVDDRLAGRRPFVGREIEPEDRRLVLPGSVDREHRDAAVEPAVAVERDHRLLEAVHAGDRDHRRNAAALGVRRKVEPARNRLPLKWNPHRLDVMIGELGISGEAFALPGVERDVGLVVLVIGPLRRRPLDRCHEIVVARSHLVVSLLRGPSLGFAAAGDGFEGRSDVGHLLHALADDREIRIGLVAAGRVQIERARLVPVDAVSADDVVDEPALLDKALHVRLAALVQNGLRGAIHRRH